MRYHYNKPAIYSTGYGETYNCNHPVYSRCTLYLSVNKGLAVIQQRCDPETKCTYWDAIDSYLVDAIYLQPGFKDFFEDIASEATDGLYPTVSLRQIMWKLRMKPLKRERWETYFDRKLV